MHSILVSSFLLSGLLIGCGGSGASGSDAGPDAGPDGPCGFESRFLPYQVGYSWTYRVTDLGTGAVSNKSQNLTAETDADLGEVIVQTTTKATGQTISALKVVGTAVQRLRQRDYDMAQTLERTSVYDPAQVRLDESAEHLTLGAAWDDVYSVSIFDPTDTLLSTGSRTDHWEILGVDVDCTSPLGTFKCLHVRRQRIAGGVSDKQYFYAKGIGKIKELNSNQVEELVSCD